MPGRDGGRGARRQALTSGGGSARSPWGVAYGPVAMCMCSRPASLAERLALDLFGHRVDVAARRDGDVVVVHMDGGRDLRARADRRLQDDETANPSGSTRPTCSKLTFTGVAGSCTTATSVVPP